MTIYKDYKVIYIDHINADSPEKAIAIAKESLREDLDLFSEFAVVEEDVDEQN